MASWNFYNDVLPFAAMISVECTNVVLNVLFKAATLKGMSYQVFLVYSYAISTLILLLPVSSLLFRRNSPVLPSLKLPVLCRIFLLAALGFLAELASYKGIQCSSPTLASALSNLTPAFTFGLAVILRMEPTDLRRSSTRAKIIGTVVSISGGLVVVLFRGPKFLSFRSIIPPATTSQRWPTDSSNSNWLVGGVLLLTEYMINSVWYIFQARILQRFPMELVVTFFYTLFVTIISVPVCMFAERDMEAWLLRPDTRIALAAILYSGFFGSFFSVFVDSWCVRLKGPVYVASFGPCSIAISAIMGAMFLGDELHLGRYQSYALIASTAMLFFSVGFYCRACDRVCSVIGAVIIALGFYAVIWGKATEDRAMNDDDADRSQADKVPLLQNSSPSMHSNS